MTAALTAVQLAEANRMGPSGPATIRRWAQEQPELRAGHATWDRGVTLYDVDLVKARVRAWRDWHRRAALRGTRPGSP